MTRRSTAARLAIAAASWSGEGSLSRAGTTRLLLGWALSLALTSCAPVLTHGGLRVQTMTGEPARGCQELGAVEGGGFRSGNLNGILRRNRAAELGATHIRYVPGAMGLDRSIVVVAYRCPGTPAASSVPGPG